MLNYEFYSISSQIHSFKGKISSTQPENRVKRQKGREGNRNNPGEMEPPRLWHPPRAGHGSHHGLTVAPSGQSVLAASRTLRFMLFFVCGFLP